MSGDGFAHVRVLVVDDHDHMRRILVTLLRAIGVGEIQEAENGEIALRVLPGFQPDLVVLDLSMPGLDGVEFARRVRRDAQGAPRVPIIMVTGHSGLHQVLAARDAGVDEVLAKPLTPKALLQRIDAVIESERPFILSETYVGPCRRRLRVEHYGPWRRAEDEARRMLDVDAL